MYVIIFPMCTTCPPCLNHSVQPLAFSCKVYSPLILHFQHGRWILIFSFISILFYALFLINVAAACCLSSKPFITDFKILWCSVVNVDHVSGFLCGVALGVITRCRSPNSMISVNRLSLRETAYKDNLHYVHSCYLLFCLST